MTVALFGGVFDPPHNGHVALAAEAERTFAPERLVVLVAERPGHKGVETSAESRLELARAAFPSHEVDLDHHERTVDLLREERFDDPLFLVGADEFADFLTWKDPDEVLARARLGVATRPGFPRERLERVLERLGRRERVLFFELEPLPIASRDLRALAAAGESLEPYVPFGVARIVRERGLYRRAAGLH